MKLKYAIGIALSFFSVFETKAQVSSLPLPEKASCAALSPQDGSLWIGTAGNGLVRTGRNGRTLTYDAARFGAPIDTVAALTFLPDGRLLVENSAGQRFSYSSAGGFVEEPRAEEEPVITEPEPVVEPAAPEKRSFGWLFALLALIAGAVGGYFGGRMKRQAEQETAAYPAVQRTPAIQASPAVQTAPAVQTVPETPAPPVIPATKPEVKVEIPPKTVKAERPATPVTAVVPDESFSKKVLAMIEEHLADPDFNVEAMAQEMGISRIHVNRKMKELMGTSPSVLINKTRMERAGAMLREGQLSIAQVGKAIGFDTPSYFSSAFRRYYGKTPKEFQENK